MGSALAAAPPWREKEMDGNGPDFLMFLVCLLIIFKCLLDCIKSVSCKSFFEDVINEIYDIKLHKVIYSIGCFKDIFQDLLQD